jgi:hypothetical protein
MNESILLFLQQLHGAMANKEQFRVELTKNGDSLDMIVLPLMGDDESKVPEEAKAIRSALSMPLSMRNMSLDEMADDFTSRLSGFGQARTQANTAYQELLATLNDATANAKNNSAKKGKTTQADTSASAEPVSQPKQDAAAPQADAKQDEQPAADSKPAGGLLAY